MVRKKKWLNDLMSDFEITADSRGCLRCFDSSPLYKHLDDAVSYEMPIF